MNNKLVLGLIVIVVLVGVFALSSFTAGESTVGSTLVNNAVDTGGTSAASTTGNGVGFTQITGGVQEVSVRALSTGSYDVREIRVKKGVPVKFSFSADQDAGCGKALYIPDFDVQLISRNGETVSATFTPTTDGIFAYRCGMNMFRGTLIVGDAVIPQSASNVIPAQHSCGRGGGCGGCGGF